MADQVTSAELTNAASVNFDKIPCTDTLKFKSGQLMSQTFRNMRVCQQLMWTRALGTVEGSINFTVHPIPGAQLAVAVGIVPEDVDNHYVPASLGQVLACGGSVWSTANMLRDFTYTFKPGVSRVLKTATTDVVAGNPPNIYLLATTDAASPVDVYLSVNYTLSLQGMGYISPFQALKVSPMVVVPTAGTGASFTAAASGTGMAP